MNKPRNTPFKTPLDYDAAELADSAEFNRAIDRDFAAATDHHSDGFSRRRWLQLMGASLALGTATGCRYEEEKIAPFAFRPQNRVPGIPEHFATMLSFGGVAQPLLSTNNDGRPTKLDGNPEHPESMGASSTFTQATMLEFYDPDRLRAPLKAGKSASAAIEETDWDAIDRAVGASLSKKDLSDVAILAEPTCSPSLFRLQGDVMKRGGSWFTFSAVADDNTRAGTKQAFGKVVRPHYKFDKAKVIVTLDADPIGLDPAGVGNAYRFALGRDADGGSMSRLYAIESQYSITGSAADHRLAVASSDIAGFVGALAEAVASDDAEKDVDRSLSYRQQVLAAMAQDLVKHSGEGIIIAGERQPPEVHAAVHKLNESLNNIGRTIEFIDVPDSDRVSTLDSITDFATQLSDGRFRTIVIVGGNPVYNAPQALKLADLLKTAGETIHITSFSNETSRCCKWVTAAAHPLETWQDGYANDGSVLIGQPLINPLFGGKSELEALATLLGLETTDSQSIVRETADLKDADWQQAVHDGFVAESAAKSVSVELKEVNDLAADDKWSKPWDGSSVEVVFNTSHSVYDGRYANSAWMQELPDFFTKISWDNVASVSPGTAEKLGLQQGKLATFTINGAERSLPVNIQPGQADGSIGMEIGYGRTAAGRVGGDSQKGIDSIGVDVSPFRSLENWNFVPGLGSNAVQPTGTNYRLAIVQEPWTIDDTGRNEIQARMFRDANKQETDRSALIREGSFASYQEFRTAHPDDHSHDHLGHDHADQAHGHDHDDGQGDHEHEKAEDKQEDHSDEHTGDHKDARREPPKSSRLPVLNNVMFRPESDAASDHPTGDHQADEHHAHHAPQWPEAFHMHHELFDLTPGVREHYRNEGNKDPSISNVWGMSIDLNKCIGCNSCVVACQSENNIPVVGKADVWRGREMHWMRIDRYYGDDLYNQKAIDAGEKQIIQQPVTCHHCENAPCETVCPVAATVHSNEGLNDMVYNRCIGTRYCGNNCPYKVRRFNFFNYSDAETFLKYPGADKLPAADRNIQNLMMNPEVSVRSRGVMEKCTYCVQRIQNTKIQAKNEKRDIGPNEITTACQDACPTKAIKFGDLHNPESDVAKAHANPRAYVMLEELNNYPRTRYLARVRNVHPQLMDFDDRDSIPKYLKHDHVKAPGGA